MFRKKTYSLLKSPKSTSLSALRGIVLLFITSQFVFSAEETAATGDPVSDDLIRVAVENELLSSEAVRAHNIDVDVQKGVVTLSGLVDSLLAKQEATRRAAKVRGVVSVVNQIVIPVSRGDAEIERDVKDALATDPATEEFEVETEVNRGRVTLSGSVDSYAEKMVAERVASGVAGIVALANKIEVNPTPERPDTEISHEIQRLLDASADLDDAVISVEVDDGSVVLNGTVATDYQKNIAVSKAWLAGASAVDDRGLDVDWDLSDGTRRHKRYMDLTDEKVREAVLRAFEYDPWIVGAEPEVAVNNGVVTLEGSVPSLRAKESAAEIAANTTGVVEVRNRLKVRYAETPPSDEAIVALVRNALLRDAYTEKHDIIVRSRNAHVSLYGLVDAPFEKERAAWIASGQQGVLHVANYLTVLDEWTPKSDEAIKEDLEKKLSWTMCCQAGSIDVTVENGVAILEGEVATWRQWQAAMDAAIEAGARRPHNLLDVRYRLRPGDPDSYVPR